jgi:hypothetical protein
MKTDQNKILLITAGTALALFVAAQHSYLANILLHNFINTFAGGRSEVKVGIFLFYIVFLSAVALLPNVLNFLAKWRIKTNLLFIAIFTTFLYGFALLLVFFQKLGISIKSFVAVFHNDEVSSTMLLHNHLLKGFNGFVLNLFHAAKQENVDTGFAFVGLLPSVWYIIGGVLVFASAVLLLLKFAEIYKDTKANKAVFVILYAIVSFSILKNMLDGGLFNHETPIAITAFIIIIWIHAKNKFSSWWIAIPIAVYIVIAAIIWQAKMDSFHYLTNSLFTTGTMAAMLGAFIFWHKGISKQFRLGVLISILAATFMYVPVAEGFSAYIFSHKNITSDGALIGLYNKPAGPESGWIKTDVVNDLSYYSVHPSKPTSFGSLLHDNHLLDNLTPITLPWETCLPTNPLHTIRFTLVTEDPISEQTYTHDFGQIINIQQSNPVNGIPRYSVSMAMKPCTPRTLNAIEELLKERGLHTFFIINLFESEDGP